MPPIPTKPTVASPKPAAKPAPAAKPKMVNRGPAGLLTKKPASPPVSSSENTEVVKEKAPVNKIAQALRVAKLVHPVDKFTLDPENARVHPERNLESIRSSLELYGQLKPIVVRKETMVVVAGNGTLTCAMALGWTEIAAVIIPMTEVEAAGYGIADNRTAELAKWDFEVIARLDKLLQEAGHESIGWSKDELEVLRSADWTPPAIDDTPGAGPGVEPGSTGENDPLLVGFTPEEYEQVGEAIHHMRIVQGKEEMSQASCLRLICSEWTKSEKGGWHEKMHEAIENGLDVNGEALQTSEDAQEEEETTEEGEESP